jgi:aminoglycoside 3-N-acetyltransferase I
MTHQAHSIRRLQTGDLALFRQMIRLFADCFDDPASYLSNPPDDAYLAGLLKKDNIITIAAHSGDAVVGGLVAYELDKFEQQRREIYIYDLAVDARCRRQGVATAMIDQVREIARDRQAWVVYVQADYSDEPAVALYSKLGTREDVLHFDIDPQSIETEVKN